MLKKENTMKAILSCVALGNVDTQDHESIKINFQMADHAENGMFYNNRFNYKNNQYKLCSSLWAWVEDPFRIAFVHFTHHGKMCSAKHTHAPTHEEVH